MAENIDDSPELRLPPASFTFLLESIFLQAEMQLGLLHLGEDEGEILEPNLPMASHSIDLLAMLVEKTRGNLSAEEQRLLENGLTELRFRFVQVADELHKSNGESTPAESSQKDGPLIITADGGKGSKTE